MQRNKIISAAEAVRIVVDGDTVATGGFVGIGFPEALAVALEDRFVETGSSRAHATGRRRPALTPSARR